MSSWSSFEEFARDAERRLSLAFAAAYGSELGVEATSEALAYGWENWDRLERMDNPIGYLYRVGQSKVRRFRWRRAPIAPLPSPPDDIWVEPGLLAGLEALSANQRVTVVLVEGFEWTQREVAELLGISRSSAQKHHERALSKLRDALKVGSNA